jgi:hypothetical protein
MTKIFLTAVISVTLTVAFYEFILKNKNLIHQKEYQVAEEKPSQNSAQQNTEMNQELGMNDRVYVSKNYMQYHRMTCEKIDERTSMKKGSAMVKGFRPCPICKP